MKTNRTQQNVSPLRAPKQDSKKPATAPNGTASPISLVFYAHDTDQTLGQAEIPGEIIRCVAAAAQRAGQPVGEFIAQGIGDVFRQMEARTAKQDSTQSVAAPVSDDKPARCPVNFLVRETGVRQAAALLQLFSWELYRRLDPQNSGSVSMFGIVELAEKCSLGLVDAWETTRKLVSAHGPVPVVSDNLVDCQRSIVRLETAVRHMDVLLRMIGEELAENEKEQRENAASAPAFLEMAEDCIQLLKSQHGAAVAQWDVFTDPVVAAIDSALQAEQDAQRLAA